MTREQMLQKSIPFRALSVRSFLTCEDVRNRRNGLGEEERHLMRDALSQAVEEMCDTGPGQKRIAPNDAWLDANEEALRIRAKMIIETQRDALAEPKAVQRPMERVDIDAEPLDLLALLTESASLHHALIAD